MKTTKILISMIVMVFMAGISVQADVVTYDFDDGTLQGWSNYEGDPEGFAVLTTTSVYTPARSGDYRVILPDFGIRDNDPGVRILTSPAFWISATTSVEIWALGGNGAVDTPTWTNYSNLPAVATSGDFMGAALRRVSDGEYLLFGRRSSAGETIDAYEAIGWDAPTIAAAVSGDSPNEQYVVDIIDAFDGVWGWLLVDDITLTDVVFTRPTVARGPNPEDEADDVPRDAVLSWTPGEFANKHDVYFGASFEDVNDADRSDPRGVLASEGQIATTYDAGRLDFGQTYYWRIDEVNAPPDSTIFKGDVWSFTVEPFSYPIAGENITATASSQTENQGPENTINGSGLENDQHSTDLTEMWFSAPGGQQPTWIQYEFDKVYKLHQMLVWNHNGLMERMMGIGFKDVSIEYSVNGTDYTTLGATHEFAQGTGSADYEHNTTVDFSGALAKYVRLTANSNWMGFLVQYGLSEVRFLYIPVFAREPSPDSGATDVDVDVTLVFRAGREAAEHDVYLSTDEQAVIDGTAPVNTVTENSYSTALDVDSTYYWRVDEVNDAETPTMWQGEIWNFTTPEFLVVDDFESYNDLNPDDPDSKRIFNTWIDGYGTTTNGSIVGNDVAPFAEQFFVHGGNQSMPLFYDNTSASLSEATANTNDLPIGSNWSLGSPQTLVLWFRGDPGNNAATDQLYVKVGNSKMIYDGDATDITRARWNQWNIDLTGENLSNVSQFVIGIERTGAGSSGVVFVDDIRLYREAPPIPVPVDPGTDGLVAHYQFENNTQDSSGSALHGTAIGEPTYVQGLAGLGNAIVLNDTGTYGDMYVDLPIGPTISTMTDITVTAWVNWSGTGGDWQRIFDFGTGPGESMYLTPTTGGGMFFNISGSTLQVPDALPTGWQHVAVVIDSTSMTMQLYLYGIEIASGETATLPSGIGDSNQNWLGRSQYEWDPYFYGSMDDVRIYDRALSAGEVLYLSNMHM